MRIYYFGELIEDTNAPKQTQKTQMELQLEQPQIQRTVMERADELLQDIDMNLEASLPFGLGYGQAIKS